MKTKMTVPTVVIKRLPRYYRYLSELLSCDVSRVSSADLSRKMGVTASQIRQDFNCFGDFGQQGYGYNVKHLHEQIGEILGMNRHYSLIIIGAGNLGHALANYAGIEKRGYRIIGIFDNNPKKIGTKIKEISIYDIAELEDFCQKNQVDIAVLSIPKPEVKEITNRLVSIGIKGLWNFSYAELETPDDIIVENVHLSDSLMTLSYKITQE